VNSVRFDRQSGQEGNSGYGRGSDARRPDRVLIRRAVSSRRSPKAATKQCNNSAGFGTRFFLVTNVVVICAADCCLSSNGQYQRFICTSSFADIVYVAVDFDQQVGAISRSRFSCNAAFAGPALRSPCTDW
jgi:hypothetical protein